MKRILHHTSISREEQPNQFYATNRYHRGKWGMKSRTGYYHGYTDFMGTNGVVTRTRYPDEEGAHTIGHNMEGAIALCIAMDGNREVLNKRQIVGFRKFDRENPGDDWDLHRELTVNRTCPGNLITREWFNNNLINSNNLDVVDVEKRKEIQRLNGILDGLMEMVLMLISMLKINK